MLIWIFGPVQTNTVHVSESARAAGFLELENARVRWFLSVDETSLPADIAAVGQRTFRSITVNNQELEFSGGFTDLHTLSYQDILDGGGFHAAKARPSIETVYTIRNAAPAGLTGDYHPFLKK